MAKLFRDTTFPLWRLDAFVYWAARLGEVIQTRGGVVPPADVVLNFATADPYTTFDPGRGRFIEVGIATVPIDGNFSEARDNIFNTSDPDVEIGRGPFTFDVALTPSQSAIAINHILQTDSGIPATVLRVINTSGSARRFHRQEDTDGSLPQVWSILARRTDGADIDGTTLTVGAAALADPLGANLAGATSYRKIRPDGWFQCYATLPNQSGVDVHYFVETQDNTTVEFESPQVEPIPAGEIEHPTDPVLTAADPDVGQRGILDLRVQNLADLPESGWMGLTVIPRLDGATTPYPTTHLLCFRFDGTNAHLLRIEGTADVIEYNVVVGGVGQATLQGLTTDILTGVPLGLVATWRTVEAGLREFALFQNGELLGSSSGGSIPTGGGTILIGSQLGSQPACVNVQTAAIGDRGLTDAEAAELSLWFRDQAENTLAQ